jgi:hypothetical protein
MADDDSGGCVVDGDGRRGKERKRQETRGRRLFVRPERGSFSRLRPFGCLPDPPRRLTTLGMVGILLEL